MSSFQIKIAACIFMAIDHIGLIFFPENIYWRLVGRLAFPLFAWAIANGFLHTRDAFRYLRRLFLFGLLIQIPYALYSKSLTLNIFFTLSLGLLAICLFSLIRSKTLGFGLVLLVSLLGEVAHVDYGIYGVLTIFYFYLYFNNLPRLILAQGLLNIGWGLLSVLAAAFRGYTLSIMDLIQPAAFFAMAITILYSGAKGRSWKYFFYVFYPIHLMVLYGLKLMLEKIT